MATVGDQLSFFIINLFEQLSEGMV